MSQADKDALTLAAMFCGRLSARMEQLGMTVGVSKLGQFHRLRVQPSTAAQLWGPSAAAASGDGGGAAAVQEKEECLLQPLKRSHVHQSNGVQAVDDPSRPCLLTDLPVELVHSICLSKGVSSPEGGVSLILLSRTCTVKGSVAVFAEPGVYGEGMTRLQRGGQYVCKHPST
jgi:hypothetical protein